MIPFTAEPEIRIGSHQITIYAALMVSGILVGRTILMRRARRFGFTEAEITPIYLTMLIAGLAGAVVAQAFITRTGLALDRLGLASIGGLAGGLLAGIAMCATRCYPFARAFLLLDIIAFAVPFASCVARLGCALAHDHRGLPSESWLAVRFPEGPRWDLGLLEFFFLALLSALFLILDRKLRRPGFFFAVAGILYGGFRIWREALGVAPQVTPWIVVMILGAGTWIVTSWKSASNRDHLKTRECAAVGNLGLHR
jgi:phosphatidylglycerol:prolipoprotein diacylglycerol transferase